MSVNFCKTNQLIFQQIEKMLDNNDIEIQIESTLVASKDLKEYIEILKDQFKDCNEIRNILNDIELTNQEIIFLSSIRNYSTFALINHHRIENEKCQFYIYTLKTEESKKMKIFKTITNVFVKTGSSVTEEHLNKIFQDFLRFQLAKLACVHNNNIHIDFT